MSWSKSIPDRKLQHYPILAVQKKKNSSRTENTCKTALYDVIQTAKETRSFYAGGQAGLQPLP